ncbi:hypothetical protein TRV_06010 [Trichophyton verrucosum HKI 0517]|uniref:Uncharacterized protein n=1 Tax=Trichophyton verrucosum (strain HKI 0517) TaxID=663202 RepID=D4DFQ9_TRIVH|nr:uncharacterized protein TRV_06010 [Trichophyton verrucosum HKI 0517]EFE39285.1 hypothetical protein TRV_06010 [Trichophyton verrucosum HKI 0517]
MEKTREAQIFRQILSFSFFFLLLPFSFPSPSLFFFVLFMTFYIFYFSVLFIRVEPTVQLTLLDPVLTIWLAASNKAGESLASECEEG